MPSPQVAVVGAGIIGLTTALRLRAAGCAVTLVAPELPSGPHPDPAVLDRFEVAGATHAAAGMLAPLTETQHSQDALAPLLTAAWRRWPALLDLVAAGSDAPTGHSAAASLVVGADRADVDQWAHVLVRAERHGRRAEPMTASALRRAAPALAPGLAGGFHAPDDHQVDPRLFARACLAALLAPAGRSGAPSGAGVHGDGGPVRLVPGRAVAVTEAADGVRVEVEPTAPATPDPQGMPASRGLDAEAVVLAAGLGHSGIRVEGRAGSPAAPPLRPVHGDVLRLRVPERLLGPGEEHLLPGPVRALVHGRSVYLVPRAGGGLVVGASAREDALAATQAGAVLDLLTDAAHVLPAVRECALEEVCTAARPGTPDDVPYVGATPGAPRVVTATGAHRHGVLLAPWMSAAAADLAAVALGRPAQDPEALALVPAAAPDRHTGPPAGGPPGGGLA